MECNKCWGEGELTSDGATKEECWKCEGTGTLGCTRCGSKKDVEDRHSFGIPAGRLCRECAVNGYKDSCGLLDGEQGDPRELEEMGEVVEPEDGGFFGE